MAANDERRFHQEWLGYLQPVGLVVAPAALVTAGVYPDTKAAARQTALDAIASTDDDERRRIDNFPRLAREIFEWEESDHVRRDDLPDALTVALPEYSDALQPDFAVPDPDTVDRSTATGWLMLVRHELPGTDLDATPEQSTHVGGSPGVWRASPHARFERLLRETGVPIGIITNGHVLRLVYAPRGESSGHLTFRWTELLTVAGRPMLAALHMLLSAERLFTVAPEKRLPALLKASRRFQNEVSTELAEQVLGALYELTYGFQAADELQKGELLREVLRSDPQHVYGGLLTTLLRLVFVCYAEDRGLLPADEVYQSNYSVGGLFERLREDEARNPDTMNQRYGAWAQLLALFRMLHDGARSGPLFLPPRHGRLFDPDAFPFLEGRPWDSRRVMGDRIDPPKVSDGCVWRVLKQLLVLDGERLSYRALDVEQIGSVYEAIMGFELVVVRGTSVAVMPKTKKPGSPSHAVLDLDAMLATAGGKRKDRLKEEADCELPAAQAKALAEATTLDALLAALGRRVSPFTPRPVPRGAMLLQPTEERRRSGSHYTPRALTEPIVRTTLEPVIAALGSNPTPEQILSLKVCDPAMGSGAFLVETCRYLGDALVEAWQRHNAMPELPPDEDAQLAARRIVAQRCIYGVDRNQFAVDLAKLSLWLVTLAREHPFTFVDHALRCGDSLVGFSRRQLAAFAWEKTINLSLTSEFVEQRLEEVRRLRSAIELMGDTDDVRAKERLLRDADRALDDVRLIGDALAAAFFSADKPKARETQRATLQSQVEGWLGGTSPRSLVEESVAELRSGERPVLPFHWEIEFPEVFGRKGPGFDAFVGNPPFAGKNTTIAGNPANYLPFLQVLHSESHGNADLVAHFFRRSFSLLREGGTFGLIATNTIAQGDTRSTGLRWLCTHGCTIYNARKRLKWPGHAAVVVSVVHGQKEGMPSTCYLDGELVDQVSAFLFHAGGHDDPKPLPENVGKGFVGSYVLGMGFTFDDDNPDEATPLAVMERLVAENPRNAERIFPYIGGEEVNDSPTHAHRRFVINFGDLPEDVARQNWPSLLAIVEEKVRPKRLHQASIVNPSRWWMFARPATDLQSGIQNLDRVLVLSRVGQALGFVFLPAQMVFSEALVVFADARIAFFTVLQSRVHEVWARFLASSMKDDLRYTPSDCFDTFPFPRLWQDLASLANVGNAYYDFRADLMLSAGEGITRTYNRFHDPDEHSPSIKHLRSLHTELDRAVLEAYGWTDIDIHCEFLLDFEEEDAEEEAGGRTRRKRKPWRYRWPDKIRDEVLARLLELNRRRAAGLPDRDEAEVASPAVGSPSAP